MMLLHTEEVLYTYTPWGSRGSNIFTGMTYATLPAPDTIPASM